MKTRQSDQVCGFRKSLSSYYIKRYHQRLGGVCTMQLSEGILTRIFKRKSLSVTGLSIESKSLEEEKISSKLTTFDRWRAVCANWACVHWSIDLALSHRMHNWQNYQSAGKAAQIWFLFHCQVRFLTASFYSLGNGSYRQCVIVERKQQTTKT